MTYRTDAAAGHSSLLRGIPSVDEILGRPRLAQLGRELGRAIVVEATRLVLAELRAKLSAPDRTASSDVNAALPGVEEIEARIVAEIERSSSFSLRPVINATGVILHTNLGRAPLGDAVLGRMRETARQYTNLEYDLATGSRGKRDVHTARLLARLIGAEAAIVVNNNAAAVFLVLNTLAKGGEVVVSRGELIEIGDGFRIPEIMAESGAVLREVGTTNRTRISDFERAINERTRLLLRVHPSNFRIVGFAERPGLEEMAELGRRYQLPVFEDLGSGCFADLAGWGVEEPVVRMSLAAGMPVISFSGDKLLGGPQAGIIAGEEKLVERIRRNPLFRALRVDKLTIAALEATLQSYWRGTLDDIPTLRMIRLTAEEIGRRASAFAESLQEKLTSSETKLELRNGASVIGGGSTPDQSLPTRLIVVKSHRHSAEELETRLRESRAPEPVIARIENDCLVLDLRTVFPEQEPALAAALLAAL